MENLQDGDRFYYLTRTAGLNMLTQLEGNSFSELIMRNTSAEGLPAEVFARPDFTFDVTKLGHERSDPRRSGHALAGEPAAHSQHPDRRHDPLQRAGARHLERLRLPDRRSHPLERGR